MNNTIGTTDVTMTDELDQEEQIVARDRTTLRKDTETMQVIYTASATATGDGRNGHVRASDGVDVGIGPADGGVQYQLTVAIKAETPGVDEATARDLLDAAHGRCPYSRATRDNIDVRLTLA